MKLFFLDTETTGLSPKPDCNEIIQLGGIVTDNRTVVEAISLKSAPTRWNKVSYQALQVTGLSKDVISKYPHPKESFNSLYNLLDKHSNGEKYILAGQNVGFDHRFLDRYWADWKDDSQKPYSDLIDTSSTMELMDMTKPLKEMGILLVPNVKLKTIAEALELKPQDGLHDAMSDIDLTYRSFFDIIDRIRSMNNEMIMNKFYKYVSIG